MTLSTAGVNALASNDIVAAFSRFSCMELELEDSLDSLMLSF
jgi:hypothetical protein